MTQPAPNPAPTPGDPAPAPTEPPIPQPAPPDDKPLGPGGEKALAAEREARKALEKQLAELAPLKDIAAALAGGKQPGGPSEVELLQQRFAELEKTANEERAARWRLEVAQAKGLTPEQAAWIAGDSLEDLTASADRLLAAFPTAPAGPRTPAPDPSQGARGGQPGPDLDAQIREAQAKNDWRTVISLQNQKLANK
jgi:hypothetical protein